MHYVYILRCSDDSFYVGHTSSLEKRQQIHNEGRGPKYTADRRPVRLVHSEPYNSISEALRRERQIKRWTRAKKAPLVSGDVQLLKGL